MLDTANFDGILQIMSIFVFHIDWHRVEMMNFKTLMRRSMLMVDFMVMICFRFQWFRIVDNSGERKSKQWAQNLRTE